MPYIVSFVKPIAVPDREIYINDCCVGGDLVLEQLMPTLRQRYGGTLSRKIGDGSPGSSTTA